MSTDTNTAVAAGESQDTAAREEAAAEAAGESQEAPREEAAGESAGAAQEAAAAGESAGESAAVDNATDADGRRIADALAAVDLVDLIDGLALNVAPVDYCDRVRLSAGKMAQRGAPSSRRLMFDADGCDVIMRGEDRAKAGNPKADDAKCFWCDASGESRPILLARLSGEDAADRASRAAADLVAYYADSVAGEDSDDCRRHTVRALNMESDALALLPHVIAATGKTRTNSGGTSYADFLAGASKSERKRAEKARKAVDALSTADLVRLLASRGVASDFGALAKDAALSDDESAAVAALIAAASGDGDGD